MFKRGSGRPRTNWRSTAEKDLLGLRMRITCEEAEVAAQNRSEWSRSVARPMHPLRCGLSQGQRQ